MWAELRSKGYMWIFVGILVYTVLFCLILYWQYWGIALLRILVLLVLMAAILIIIKFFLKARIYLFKLITEQNSVIKNIKNLPNQVDITYMYDLNYIAGLNHFAGVYCSSGEYNKAEQLFSQSLNLIQKELGTEHPIYVETLTALADFYRSAERYRESESTYRHLSEIIIESIGKKHPVYLSNLINLGLMEIFNGKSGDGMKTLLQVSEINDLMITQMFSMSDEKEIQEYIRGFSNDYFMLLSVFSEYYSELKKYMPSVLDVVLKRKAISLEIKALRRDKILLSQHQELRDKFERLRNAQKTMARLMMERHKGKSQEYHQKIIHSLEEKIALLEKELAARISEIELHKKLENAEHKIIASFLPEDTMLVEFAWYRGYEVKGREWRAPRYLAFVLSKHDQQMIDLGEASVIDNLIERFRNEITKGQRNIIIVIPKTSEEGVVSESDESEVFTGKLLYEKLFKPISDKVGQTKKLFISPDGNITLLPFEVLPMPNGRYVVEDFEISYVDSGRDLLRFGYRNPPQSPPVIISDPDFDLTGNELLYDKSSGIRGMANFPRLHGTKTEGEAIRKILPHSDFRTDKNVLDRQIKQLAGPEILHIATHGFFIPDHKQDDQGMELFQGDQFENPLLRSAIALAGANASFYEKHPVKHAEDGLLTALDVTGMDLTGTDLVVLSACQTGLGEVRSGEGIYGLRRAFTIAGARTQIVSLWSVPDYETKELMISFYTKLSDGKGKAEALREAQRELIAKLRNEGKADYPFLWGAFICVGDPDKMKRTSSFWFRGGAL